MDGLNHGLDHIKHLTIVLFQKIMKKQASCSPQGLIVTIRILSPHLTDKRLSKAHFHLHGFTNDL